MERGALGLWILFALSLPLVTVRLYAADELQHYAPLRSLWIDGDLDLADDYRLLLAGRPEDAPERRMLLERTTPTGRAPAYGGIGCALLWFPFFVAAHGVARLGGWPADGLSAPYRAAVCYGSALYGFLGLLLLRSLARESSGTRGLDASVLVAWWATALPFYLYATPPMVHATSLFASAAFLRLWSRWRLPAEPWKAAALGLLAGVAVLVREQNALFLLLPTVDLVAGRPGSRPQCGAGSSGRLLAAASFAGAFLLASVPQLLFWTVLFGRPAPAGERLAFFRPWPRYLGKVLFGANHGLVSWHPVWALAFVGFLRFVRRRPELGGPLLGVFVANLLFLGSVTNWAGGMAFGQRRLLDCLFVVVLGLAALFSRWPRSATVAVSGLLVWWNVSLLAQFGSGRIPREGPVDWGVVVRQQLTVVPSQAATILQRYLVDRESFYRRPGPGAGS
jgi:hypothetical protein